MSNNAAIQFRDLQRQYDYIKTDIEEEIKKVITSAQFISGSEVKKLESNLAEYVGRKHCISCGNGTDAISIALIAAGIGEAGGGNKTDAVFVPDFTFFSSGECPATVGATPVFVDVDANSYNISTDSLTDAIEQVIEEGQLKPCAVVAVDLFGQPYDYDAVRYVCDKYGLLLLEDAAQGLGGNYVLDNGNRKMAGSLGDISTTSFFPAKPLGCYGDGGAIFTDDDNLAALCRSIAVHGKDMEHPDDPNAKYNNIRLGMNSRLDTLQAGILLAKFPAFRDSELEAVNYVAKRYTEQLSGIKGLILPHIGEKYYSSWAQYTVQLPENADRNSIRQNLKRDGIPTNIYYIKPMHRQGAFLGTRSSRANCLVTDELCERVLCLPIHPYLKDREVDYICDKLQKLLM